jgi:hypothetical protein
MTGRVVFAATTAHSAFVVVGIVVRRIIFAFATTATIIAWLRSRAAVVNYDHTTSAPAIRMRVDKRKGCECNRAKRYRTLTASWFFHALTVGCIQDGFPIEVGNAPVTFRIVFRKAISFLALGQNA